VATFTESFDQADSTTLGPDLTWTQVVGAWETINGEAALTDTGVNAYARAEVDTGSADMRVEAVIPMSAVFDGHYVDLQLLARMDATTYTGYALLRGYWSGAGGQFVGLRKYVNGAETQIGSPVVLPSAKPETWRLEVEGSDLRAYRDDVLILSGTDTEITTGTYGGLGGYRSSAARAIRFDSFTVAEPGPTYPGMVYRSTGGVLVEQEFVLG